MLVISRKIGESIIISDDIRITIISMGGDKVSIGIDAPKDIRIMREELLESALANKESLEAVSSGSTSDLADLMKKIKK